MRDDFRAAYNDHFSEGFYQRFLGDLEGELGCKIPFRVAETPLFFPPELRRRISRDAEEIVEQICDPALIDKMRPAIPSAFHAPGMDAVPNCLQVDFAIVRAPDGGLEGKVVEFQAFPSLYALMVVQTDTIRRLLQSAPGLDKPWTIYFGDQKRDQFVSAFGRAVLAGEAPESVVLLDLHPEKQKTYPDFVATQQLLGVESVCPTKLERQGRRLFRKRDGKMIEVRRIYNRLVFDELTPELQRALPFDYRDELDVSWFSHPNWYWMFSKYTLPFVDHKALPTARLVSQLDVVPDDLENYVLKPLFSFAGSGVKVDVERAHIDAIAPDQRQNWLLQKKVSYEPALKMPDGGGVKAEVRMMFMRAPDEPKPKLVLNLMRLSRGKMLGVDHNKDMTWVGGSIGIWPEDEDHV